PLRTRLHAAARDADVLPGRPAVLPGSDVQLRRRPRPQGGGADDQRVRLRLDRGTVGARLPLGHRAARRDGHADRGAARMTTPSQTVGPYLSIGLPWPDGPEVVPEGTPGRIRLYGKVFDGEGAVIPDALIETWQADADGK